MARQSASNIRAALEENVKTLEVWRSISSSFAWDDNDPPPSDILAARLRAKYYGATYISTRPYLDFALHVREHLKDGTPLEKVTVDAFGKVRDFELALFRAMQTMPSDMIKQKARTCVWAAIKSTEAFDGVPDRLIVTNITGTAHAQFGNMLVLAATYKTDLRWLSDLVPREKMQQLFRRTINFLSRLKYTSKTANTDMEILRTVEWNLFGQNDDRRQSGITSQNASFSSGY